MVEFLLRHLRIYCNNYHQQQLALSLQKGQKDIHDLKIGQEIVLQNFSDVFASDLFY